MRKLFLLFPILLSGTLSFAQQEAGAGRADRRTALILSRQAAYLMESDSFDEAVRLLDRAQELDPANDYMYTYETVYAHYLKKDYRKAIEICETLSSRPDCDDLLYQLWGNACDLNDRPGKARKIYEAGLERFPNSGRLYMEKGTLFGKRDRYADALQLYQQGINVEPTFPSNYFYAALCYSMVSPMDWSQIYSEMFLIMEPDGVRHMVASRLLFESYKNYMFFGEHKIIRKESNPESFQIEWKILTDPFDIGYNKMFNEAMAKEEWLNTTSLRIREWLNIAFLVRIRLKMSDYFENNLDSLSQDVEQSGHDAAGFRAYSQFLTRVKQAGHWEAYNYWLLRMTDMEEFTLWYDKNPEKFQAFSDWFDNNHLTIQTSRS